MQQTACRDMDASTASGGGCGGTARKVPWRPSEDVELRKQVAAHGARDWPLVSQALPGRSAKSCRLRWCNHLAPELNRLDFTAREDETIVREQRAFGNKWATIARLLPGRSDNAVKNRWNSVLKKQHAGAPPPHPNRECKELFPLSHRGTDGDDARYPSLESATEGHDDPRTRLTLGLPGWQDAPPRQLVSDADVDSLCCWVGLTDGR